MDARPGILASSTGSRYVMGLDHSPPTPSRTGGAEGAVGTGGPAGDDQSILRVQRDLRVRESLMNDGRRELGHQGAGQDGTVAGVPAFPKWQLSREPSGTGVNLDGHQVIPVESKVATSLTSTLSLQGLLSQFGSSRVRADFVNERFECCCTPDRLAALDEIRWTLFPRWTSGSLEHPGDTFVKAAAHLEKLLLKSEELFFVDGMSTSQSFTYYQWNETLEELCRDPYWNATPSGERCTHFHEPSAGCKKERTPWSPKIVNSQPNRGPSRTGSRPHVEEITLLTSGDSSVDISDSASCSESSSGSSPIRMSRGDRRAGRLSDKREVVVPPPFEMSGKTKLKEFLDRYEHYFQTKYKGNSYDMCQHLEAFLQGELLEVYKVSGGRRIKYKKMKEKLLEFRKKSKVGSKSHWRTQLLGCSLNYGESLDLYGMRLLGIAELAFPKSPKECAAQVRQQFLNTIPGNIRSRILDAERAMKAFSGGKAKHLSFSAMTEMARELQAEAPQVHSVMWADHSSSGNAGRFQGREFVRRASSDLTENQTPGSWRQQGQRRHPSSSDPQGGFKKLFCSFCGKRNHKEQNCWRANKACLICGGQHFMKDCDQYKPNFKRHNNIPLNSNDSVPRGGN